jgi:glucosyl-dolichyl phosphate glucuronosyltransferase
MNVSIIICTCNRAEDLRQTLMSIAEVCVPDGIVCELIVVDNASSDHTAEVVRCHQLPNMPVRYFHEPRRGKGYAYNAGMAAAGGNIFLFTDDDVRPPRDWISGMCQPIWNGHADAVAGGVRIAPHLERPWMQSEHRICFADTERLQHSEYPLDLVGANMAFSRKVLTQVPAFDVELGPGALGFGDETLFSRQLRQANCRIIGALYTIVEHHFDPTRLLHKNFAKIHHKMGRSHAYLAYHWEHRDIQVSQAQRLYHILRLAYWRLKHVSEWLVREGSPWWEMRIMRDIGFISQYLIEQKRPRNYSKFGLQKLRL